MFPTNEIGCSRSESSAGRIPTRAARDRLYAFTKAIVSARRSSMTLENTSIGRNFWRNWILANALAGALLGFMQWRALRRHVAMASWMVLGSSVGLALGYIGGYEVGGFPFDYLLGPALAGLLGGVAQWFALRRRGAGAGWLVAAGTFGFLLGGIAAIAIGFLGLGEAIGGSYLGWIALNGLMGAVIGAIGSAISGAVLARHLRRATAAPMPELLSAGAR